MIKLKATSTHPKHPAGTIYEAEAIYAASDVYLHRAVFATDDEPLTIEPTNRRIYKRRDMKAEQ